MLEFLASATVAIICVGIFIAALVGIILGIRWVYYSGDVPVYKEAQELCIEAGMSTSEYARSFGNICVDADGRMYSLEVLVKKHNLKRTK